MRGLANAYRNAIGRDSSPVPSANSDVRVTCPGLGNATPQETISPEASTTGLSVASREESALRTDAVVVIVFIRCSRCMRGARGCGPSLRRAGAYARTAPFVLWKMTSPSVTFGGVLRIRSSFSSRTHSDATRVDSLACVGVSKRPIELITPSPVSIRK